MPTVEYFYLRMLELEGRHPADAGAWAATFHRLMVGEGQPPGDHPAATVEYAEGEPFPPSPRVPSEVTRPGRWFFYQRLRTSTECERYLLAHPDFHTPKPSVNIQLSTDWAAPPGGVIPMPNARTLLKFTHNVFLWGCRPERRLFLFQNTWGENWGYKGAGTLPYDYFDRYCFDSWAMYHSAHDLALFRGSSLDSTGRSRWSARDDEDYRRYGFDVWKLAENERLGWAFAVERDGAIEVEEFYVRAEHRGHGHGRWLGAQLVELARAKSLPLRAWVQFADSRRESPGTSEAMLSTLRRMNLRFRQSPVRWAAYLATNEGPGADEPIEPVDFPERPRSPIHAVVAAALALGAAGPPPSATPSAVTQPLSESEEFPGVGTPAWGRMNQERAALIRKKVRGELTEAERGRYEYLQSQSLAALDQAFPREAANRE